MRFAACLLTAALVAGCQNNDPFAQWSDQDLAQQVQTYQQSGNLPAASRHRRTAESPASSPMQQGHVDAYVTKALSQNAQIRAAFQETQRLRERIPQARALPDPMASITFGQLAQTAAGQVDYIVGVSQSLPFPGTLNAREQVARQQVVESLEKLAQTTQQVEADVRRTYWSYFAATRKVRILDQNRQLLEQIEATVNARVRVNQAGQDDLLRITRRLARLENRQAEMRQRVATASAMLNRLMSQPTGLPLPPPPCETPDRQPLDRDQLIQTALLTNPAVRIARAQAETYRERLSLAKTERLPDFMLGFQYGAVGESGLSPVANGEDQFAGTVGVSIPLWTGQYDAAEREALRGVGQAVANVRAAEDRAAFEVDDALARYEANQNVLRRLRERMMPDARQTIELAIVGYQNGRLELLQLFDDWQALLDDQLEEAQTIANMNRALADIQQTLGQPIAQTTTVSEDDI